MLIKNATNGKNVGDAELCSSLLSKFVGLMFSKNKSRMLIFKFDKEITIHLHMLFVFHPIDVLFLDKNKIVVDKKESFKPFAFYKSKKRAMYAIEMPEKTIKKTETEVSDEISF